jgi:hypothetical protein
MRLDFRTNVRQDADLLLRAYRRYGAQESQDYHPRRQSVTYWFHVLCLTLSICPKTPKVKSAPPM